MCGIAGFLSSVANNSVYSRAVLTRMTGVLRHRGPDADGHWQSEDGRVSLGHRRLLCKHVTQQQS